MSQRATTKHDIQRDEINSSLIPSLRIGGRLTLVTNTPVMSSNILSGTVVYYTPYIGDSIPIYDGVSWYQFSFPELSNTTTDNTKNPAAVGNNSNYDLFVWNDAGNLRLGRGPAWSSDTARGTGAGTTELERVNGILVNKNSITNGAGVRCGTYVGSIRSDGGAKINWFPATSPSSKGTTALLGVWNMYNRRLVYAISSDSDNSWTYNSTTIRATNGGNVRANIINGLDEDSYDAVHVCTANGGASGDFVTGIGLDATNAYVGLRQYGFSGAFNYNNMASMYKGLIGLGFHFLAALESQITTASAATFIGDQNTPTQVQNGLYVSGMM